MYNTDSNVDDEDQKDNQKNVEKKSEHKIMLEKWLNKNFRIKLSDNRIIVGVFLCTDCHQNIILGSSLEFLNDDDEDPRLLGLAMVPGEHIMSICVDEIEPIS
ncbi:LSMD1 domain-containing protein Sbat [Dermatophagoides pteronyssinus]|uniref:N-alpha-acetyltransferase 38, NatC auxiliary subunit-like n=1 Tax=Dermatophagoides pteronyssinus TaxID=6956 RepID=A0A6P6YCQ1_DERPT|nr:N-alpha-acetyltransferase 38, NatC auxiliary subunit-like [Dermatophagoides pteronyssinus]